MDFVNVSGFRAPDLLENAKIKEAVKHPKHYQGIKGLEVFTVMEISFRNTRIRLMDT